MLPAILACALASPLQDSPAVRVLARDDEGFGVAAVVTPERPWAVPIPLTTRSEVVQRVVPGPDGLVFRFEGVDDPLAISIEVVEHAVDHQVLCVDGLPTLVGPPTLPKSAKSDVEGPSALGLIARRDGVCADTEDLILDLDGVPKGHRSILIFDEGTVLDQWPNEAGWPASIDQVFYAICSPPEPREVVPVDVSNLGGTVEVRVREDAAQPGRTLTYLVSVEPSGPTVEGDARRTSPRPAGILVDRSRRLEVLDNHLEGPDEQLDIRPTMGPGIAWGDVDGDGWTDLYLVHGGGRAQADVPPNRLLHSQQGRRFVDVTPRVGGDDRGAGMGAQFFDGDGDGDLDLYVANYGADVLFANEPGERLPRLVDVSSAAGVGGDKWSAGIAASDYDRDGDLDLYVTSYLVFDPALMPPVEELLYQREDPIEMLPFAFPGQANTFLRNESDAKGMRFVDVTDELGVADVQGRGMQPVFLDFDRDGDDDLYVANDVSYNVLYRNEGDGTFADVSFSVGLDDPRGGMGLATGDVDGDLDEDVFLTNWELEPNALYLNNLLSHKSRKHHVATFRDGIVASGLGPSGIGRTSWGCELFDLENDGDLDLFVANGYTSPDYESTGICVGQPNQLFVNDGTGRFTDASAKAGPDVTRRLPSRAAVACDFDGDGDVDLVVTANNGPVQLLVNETPEEQKGRWLLVRLRGADGNTHGIGAEVTVRAGERTWRRQLRAGTSYLGGNPPELHFGLGALAEGEPIASIEVRWPSGKTTTHAVGVDRVVTLTE